MPRGTWGHRGQVLIIFVFAVIGLVGITGLAIDGGNVYSDRRHAQNAADTASLAAAVVKINQQKNGATACTDLTTPSTCGALVKTAAMNMAATNGYTSNIVDNTVEVHIPPIDGPYSDCTQAAFNCNDYIQVIINSNVNTWFARVLGVPQLHNRVEAVALARYAPTTIPYDGMSLVELGRGKGSCPSDFNVGGSGTVTLYGGGIYVNSSNPACAYKQTSCTTTLVLAGNPQASIQVYGGWDLNGCNSPPITKATYQYPFPPDRLLSEPPECSTAGTFGPSATGTTYNPGNYYGYNQFPVNNDNATLNPGVYCINGSLQTTKDITGNGVLIYIRPTGKVNISGGTVVLTAPTSGTYAGYLIYQDWDNTSTPQNCGIQGNSGSQYTGLIFVPYCKMTISGTSDPSGFAAQVIAYQLSLTGTNILNFTYDANSLPKIPEIQKTGLYH